MVKAWTDCRHLCDPNPQPTRLLTSAQWNIRHCCQTLQLWSSGVGASLQPTKTHRAVQQQHKQYTAPAVQPSHSSCRASLSSVAFHWALSTSGCTCISCQSVELTQLITACHLESCGLHAARLAAPPSCSTISSHCCSAASWCGTCQPRSCRSAVHTGGPHPHYWWTSECCSVQSGQCSSQRRCRRKPPIA